MVQIVATFWVIKFVYIVCTKVCQHIWPKMTTYTVHTSYRYVPEIRSWLCIVHFCFSFLVTIDRSMAEPESARKKRKCLKMEDKQKVIDAIKAGKHVEDIIHVSGISKSQAYRIFQRKDSIVRAVTEGSVPTQSKVVVNKAKYPIIDEAVFQWFCSIRSLRRGSKPLSVSRALIQARAVHEATAPFRRI